MQVFKIFKSWTVIEFILLILNPVAVLTIGLIFNSDALTIIASITGIFTALLLAKGLVAGQFIGIFSAVTYIIVSYFNGFYGEMIIYIALMLPMYFWGIITWIKHKNKKTETVEISSIKWQEWLGCIIISIGAFIGFYYLLKALNTNELIVSTISLVSSIFAVYMLARRSKYGFISFIANDIILIILWGIPVFTGNLVVMAMFLNPIINLLNDTYGVINWTILQKKQNKNPDTIINEIMKK